jgi:hypothetical protein
MPECPKHLGREMIREAEIPGSLLPPSEDLVCAVCGGRDVAVDSHLPVALRPPAVEAPKPVVLEPVPVVESKVTARAAKPKAAVPKKRRSR